jgi:hypothetical protein
VAGELTSILQSFDNQPDLTTFVGRLKFAMEVRKIKSEQFAQVFVRKGFSVTRKNIDQWCRIDENTWRGKAEQVGKKWKVIKKGAGLDDSRGPYPVELQYMVVHLKINGMWLMVGGNMPMERGGGIPITAEDMSTVWEAGADTRFLINHVMKMNKQSRAAITQYLAATNQIDYIPSSSSDD